MCPKCFEMNSPFYNITNIELENVNTSPLSKNVNITNDLIDLNQLREKYNFSNIFKSSDPNDINSIQDLVNCDYYDTDEFKKLLKTLPKK